MKYRELTWEEACTLYDAGLRDGVQFFVASAPKYGWNDDDWFNPHFWPESTGYRIPIEED